ncbi:anion transporter [Clostridium sp. P21]|uniref:Anion transporter n=1 Tax=Clostridium muellerianum TaxID=2716538 RepID=A0A7Y0HRN3_9CLOT|nr:SLC13 family permease [Clostridium muellerianum]NMM65028.1 anion transporter [Clostridium muellerianum]
MEGLGLNSQNVYRIIEKLKMEKVFCISLILSIFTSFFVKPQISYINFKVIVLLFNLMIIISALEKLKFMDKIAVTVLLKCKNTRRISIVFIIITFFASMLVTNDVALLTFVPLAMLTFKKAKFDPMKTIILQTLAANIGSSLTPMGNPQNLFLFTYYNLSSFQFFSITIPFVASGVLWLILLNKRVPKKRLRLSLETVNLEDKKRTSIYLIIFAIVIFSVFGIINYKYAFLVVIIGVLFMDKYLIKQVDYFLLATFICFFIFIGNISNIKSIQVYLHSFLQMKDMPYFSSIVFSQLISNVPCSVLVSGFTENWKQVLLGVNIGGMGTLIASLASLISYKIFINENEDKKNKLYLSKFNIYSFASLFLFTIANYLYIHL